MLSQVLLATTLAFSMVTATAIAQAAKAGPCSGLAHSRCGHVRPHLQPNYYGLGRPLDYNNPGYRSGYWSCSTGDSTYGTPVCVHYQ